MSLKKENAIRLYINKLLDKAQLNQTMRPIVIDNKINQ